MSRPKVSEQELARFGRILSLVLNRVTMYKADHPYVLRSLEELYPVVERLLRSISPLVFAMNREQFFVDEEPLDPRVNVSKIVWNFKKAGIQSISFEEGLEKSELSYFLEVFVSLSKYPNAEAMKKALARKGIKHLKINHVIYRKVTADDEVVSRDAFGRTGPEVMDEAQHRSKKLFIDMVLESVLAEEFTKTLSISNLLKNPSGLSRNMIEADIDSFSKSDAQDRSCGPVLLHQLEMIDQEVERDLSKGGNPDFSALAEAVFDMKKQLLEGIEAQKAAQICYSNEEEILGKANEITDKVLIRLIREEYKAGSISTQRLGQILRRMIPDP